MTQAKCFNCLTILEAIGKSMEELLKDEFPVFCSFECADEFSTEDNEKIIRFKKIGREMREVNE